MVGYDLFQESCPLVLEHPLAQKPFLVRENTLPETRSDM